MMDSLRNKLKQITTEERFVRSKPPHHFFKTEVHHLEPFENSIVRAHELVAIVSVKFHCTHADLHGATQNAERVVMQNIYGGFMDKLHELMGAVYAGDTAECQIIVDHIRKEITK